MRHPLNIPRLFAEIVATFALAQVAVMVMLPLFAPGVHGVPEAILDATMLSLLAGPVILWRVRAAVARKAGSSADTPTASRRWLVMTATGILLVGFIATGFAAWETRQVVQEEASARFGRLTERLVGEATRRINQPRFGLAGARGVYAASKSVERGEFEAYTGSRDLRAEFPGALGFGFIQRVVRTDVDAFIAAERADGAPDFAIKSLAAPGSALENAPDLYVIKHCFPKERNAQAWGLDIGSEPVRRAAAERAVTTGEPAMSGRITLVQDQQERNGFLCFLPVYRNGATPRTPEERKAALVGLAFVPLVLEEALAGVDKSLEGLLDFEIFDGEAMTSDAMLFDLDGHLRPSTGRIDASAFAGRMLEQESRMNIAGRTWTFSTSTTPKFEATVSQSMPLVVGMGGVLLSMLLTTIFWSLGTGRARALSMAQTMTVDLTAAKAQADRLGDIARRTSNAVIIADPQGRIEWVNEGFTRITGYTLDEVKGKKPGSFLTGPNTDPSASRLMGEAVRRGEGCRTEIVNYGKSGREYTLDIEIMPRRDEAGVLTGFMAIESDITEQKRAAAELAASEAKVRAIIDASPVPMAINEQDRITFVNPAFTRTFGYELTDIPTLSEWWPRAYPDESYRASVARSWNAELERSARDGDAFVPMELRVRAKNGAEVVALVGADPIVTALKESVLVSLFDITARKQAEEFLRSAIDALDSHTVVLDSDATVLSVNRAWRDFAQANGGIGDAQCEGANYLKVCDKAAARSREAASVAEALRAVLAGPAEPAPIEYPCHSPTERRWFLCSIRGFSRGGKRFAVVSHLNISARKKAEKALTEVSERLQLATQAGGVGTWEYRVAENKVSWDGQMFKLYGITGEKFGGAYEAWLAGVHPEDREHCDQEIRQALNGEKDFDTEFRVVWPDGTTRHIRGMATVQRDSAGQPLGMVGTNWDVTERKHNELQIQEANGRLAAALQAAEAASRAKSAFLANMSHEIRTPLTAILGFADLLREDGNTAIAPEQRLQTIDTIRNAGQHLLTVINDILDLSKIEADRMTVEKIETPVTGILREVESLMRPRAAGKGLTLDASLTSPIPAQILSDPTRLRQILMNLAGNAVKFTEHGRVTIRVGAAERDGHTRLVIDVEDTGLGMTTEQAERLFQAFGQADETVTRKHGGSGLGLTISRRLAAMMGGDVKLLHTEPGKGSCFRLVLPLEPAPGAAMVTQLDAIDAAPTPKPAPSATLLQGRILLAEDGADNQRLISFHLKKAGAAVHVADNGRIALEMLDKAAAAGTPYDLLLTDMQMPEMDGYTLARTLRARGSTLPIVALTAHAMAEDRSKCIEAGCDDYATKPIDKAVLLETCHRWMLEARSKQQTRVAS